MIPTLALLLALQDFQVGDRWTYKDKLGRRVVAEIWEPGLLRVWGGEILGDEDVFLDAQFRWSGSSKRKLLKPVPLLPPRFEAGVEWDLEVPYLLEGAQFDETIRARVDGRAKIGSHDTWLLNYGEHALWYSPKVGIVKTDDFELQHAELGRKLTNYPELKDRKEMDRLVALFQSDELEVRADAEQKLFALGAGIMPHLEKSGDPHVQAVLRKFIRIELKVTASNAKVGEELKIEARLHNPSPVPVLVVPRVYGCEDRMGRKFPALSIVIRDSRQKIVERSLTGSYWGTPALRGRDFRRLLPDDSLDLLEAGSGWRLDWPGTYTVQIVYDISGDDWDTDEGPPDEEAKKYLREIPKGRYVSDPVTFVVEK